MSANIDVSTETIMSDGTLTQNFLTFFKKYHNIDNNNFQAHFQAYDPYRYMQNLIYTSNAYNYVKSCIYTDEKIKVLENEIKVLENESNANIILFKLLNSNQQFLENQIKELIEHNKSLSHRLTILEEPLIQEAPLISFI